ncbi:p450 domain-containing protein, partial [Cephalotus follicularis]
MTPLSTLLQKISNPYTLAVIIFAVFAWHYLKSKSKRSASPPGPRGLPIVGNLLSLEPELHTYFMGLSRIYGPIVKLQLGCKVSIVVSSPALARQVLKDHDVTFANRDVPDVARFSSYGGSYIVWNPYGPEWRMLRKVCALKMLSSTTLDSVYHFRRREVRQTVAYLFSRPGSSVNLGDQMFLIVANVITNMLWGDTDQYNERASLGAKFKKVISEITELLVQPNLSDFFPSLTRFDLQGLSKRMHGLTLELDQIFDKIIDGHQKIDGELESKAEDNNKEYKDFLQFLLKYKDEGDDKIPLTMTHIKALLMDMVVGGTETSSNSVEFAMAEVINKPEVMIKAQEELDAVVGKDNIVEESHIPKLPYLYAIMKETLRLHPALPLLVPHCPSDTCTIGGYTIPKGSRVFINVWAIHRDPLIWPNPLEFDPKRFMIDNYDYSGNDFTYFPFGSGRRICAGIGMAERMFMYSLATLLHSFHWKLPQQVKLDLTEKFGIVMKL